MKQRWKTEKIPQLRNECRFFFLSSNIQLKYTIFDDMSNMRLCCLILHFQQILTGNGSEDIGDEDLYQALVQAVVAVSAPAQHRLVLAQQNQAGLGETFLWLIVTNPHKNMKCFHIKLCFCLFCVSENWDLSSILKQMLKYWIMSTHTANVASPAWLWLNLQKVFQRVSTRVNCRLTITSSIA